MPRKKKITPVVETITEPVVAPVEIPKAKPVVKFQSEQQRLDKAWTGERDKLGNPIRRTPENPGP